MPFFYALIDKIMMWWKQKFFVVKFLQTVFKEHFHAFYVSHRHDQHILIPLDALYMDSIASHHSITSGLHVTDRDTVFS